jgi:hypothetical protein
MEAPKWLTANIHTQWNSHFLCSNPLFLFRVHIVDISSIDEQHTTTKEDDDDDEEESGPALYISPLCNWCLPYTLALVYLSIHHNNERKKELISYMKKKDLDTI